MLGFVEGKPRAADGDGFMLLSKDGVDRRICCRDFVSVPALRLGASSADGGTPGICVYFLLID